jgi:uncharacterized membrane-anchored protein
MDKPSTSTIASAGLGVPIATIISWILNQFAGVDVPGPVEAALGAVVSTIIGYLFIGGKARDVE